MPGRADIDPLDLRFIIANLLIAECTADTPPRFRYRLWGTALTRDYGREMTGKHVDELQPPGFAERVMQAYRTVIETGQPQRHDFDDLIEDRMFRHQRLLLPLAATADGAKAAFVLGAIYRRPLS